MPYTTRRAQDEHRRLRELAEWLVSREKVWVDPQRAVERQTLTLQQIIDRARESLGQKED